MPKLEVKVTERVIGSVFVDQQGMIGPELTSSGSKLADIFTPRSRRNAEAKLADVQVHEDNPSVVEYPARRHSSRLSAKAAASVIAQTVEVISKFNYF